jgi:tungstate transport system ATP-binding protein
MSEGMAYLLERVTKEHGGRTVLDLPRFEVGAGEVVCLVGPPGSGKTTLLRLLAALDDPSSGEVVFRGERLGTGSVPVEVRRRITLLFQRPVLLTGTVLANVEYGLTLRGRTEARDRARAMLERVHLSHLADRPSHAVSGGEAQLIALARALAIEPDALLLDEPTNNLDPARVGLVEEVVAHDHRERGTTVVWATHNHFQARRVGDRVALLLEGRLVEAAPAGEFFDAPLDPRTAAFVQGRMVY